jgi:hypothetical protein
MGSPSASSPLIASLIDGGVAEATAQRQILTEARAQPHLLDDATLVGLKALLGQLPRRS